MTDILDDEFHRGDKDNFEFYRDFMNKEEALSFAGFLHSMNVPYSLETSDTVIDKAIVGNGLIPKVVLKMHPSDFKRVNTFVAEQIEERPASDFAQHYLNQFDDAELKDILLNQEEWSVEDVSIAKVILSGRGINVDEEAITAERQRQLEESREGESANIMMIIFWSLAIIFGLYVHVILIIGGFGMAYYYTYGKTTDREGIRHFVYDESTRMKGTIMLFGGAAVVAFEFLFFFFSVGL